MIEYDSDKTPELSDEALRYAKQNGLEPIQVICDEQNATVGDESGLTFCALVKFLPRKGDKLLLEDKSICLVDEVTHKLVTARRSDGKARLVELYPIVYAIRQER